MAHLDIVIPTLNEEEYLGKLLQTLTRQDFTDFRVFVSDGNSSDKTISIAKSFQEQLDLTVIVDQQKGVSRQRNLGAKAGNSPHILFLDADVELHPHFLTSLLKELRGRDIANCWLIPLSKRKTDMLLYSIYNILGLEVGQYIWPAGVGQDLYTTRELFHTLKGFDENLTFWEDVDYIKRAVRHGAKFAVLRKPKIYSSTRRFEMEGRIEYALENLKGLLYSLRTGKIPDESHMSYPMGLDYTKLSDKKSFSHRKLQGLISQYTLYKKLIHHVKQKILS